MIKNNHALELKYWTRIVKKIFLLKYKNKYKNILQNQYNKKIYIKTTYFITIGWGLRSRPCVRPLNVAWCEHLSFEYCWFWKEPVVDNYSISLGSLLQSHKNVQSCATWIHCLWLILVSYESFDYILDDSVFNFNVCFLLNLYSRFNCFCLKPLYTFGTEQKKFTDLQIIYRVYRR